MTEKLSSPRAVRDLLAALGARPSRALGQNFLIDANAVEAIAAASGAGPADSVLEIGPGLGVLTDALAARAGRLTAVELDRRFAAHLRARYADRPHVTVIESDFLKLDIPGLLAERDIGIVAANLPYNSGTRMLVELIRAPRAPHTITVTVQREVGERLAAKPGQDAYGLLTVWAQVGHKVEVVRKISPTCFFPPPAVWSAVVRLTARDAAGPRRRAPALFYALTRLAFQHRRKQLAGILDRAPAPLHMAPAGTAHALEAVGADARARPETLSTEQWLELAARVAACNGQDEGD